jgi:hypothetical protein
MGKDVDDTLKEVQTFAKRVYMKTDLSIDVLMFYR